jgi:hypothetical protein
MNDWTQPTCHGVFLRALKGIRHARLNGSG